MTPKECPLIISFGPEGKAAMIYTDDFRLDFLGTEIVGRITKVEHATRFGRTGWYSDMSAVGGPVLGPFRKRSAALKKEVDWIHRNLF